MLGAGIAAPGLVDDRERSVWASVKMRRRTVTLVVAVLLLGAWQLSGQWVSPLVFATPYQTAHALVTILFHGSGQYPSLGSAIVSSLAILGIGFGLAAVLGICIGLIMGMNGVVRRGLEPIVALGNSSPTIALLPLFIIWFGFNTLADVIFVFIVCIWCQILNTTLGARIAAERYQDLRVAFRVSRFRYFRTIVLPAAGPYIFTGLRIGIAHGIIAMILAGDEIGSSGVGGLANDYSSLFNTANVFAIIVATTVIAIILYKILESVRVRVCPWVVHAA